MKNKTNESVTQGLESPKEIKGKNFRFWAGCLILFVQYLGQILTKIKYEDILKIYINGAVEKHPDFNF